jgi:hypothetical protein
MAAGIAIAVLGIFVWFGGFGFKKILYVIIGAFCGAAFTLSFTGANPMLAAALIIGGAFAAYKLQETFLACVIALLAATNGYAILIKPYFSRARELIDVLRQVAIGVPFYNWPILLGVVLAPFAIEASWFAGASAGFTSGTAAAMFFFAAIMILKQYGFNPSAMIMSNGERIIGAIAVITIVGAAIQMLIMPRISSRFAMAKEMAKHKAKKPKKTKQEGGVASDTRVTAWRTS